MEGEQESMQWIQHLKSYFHIVNDCSKKQIVYKNASIVPEYNFFVDKYDFLVYINLKVVKW